MGLNAMIFGFWMLSFKPVFSLSSFTFIKSLSSSSSLSAIRVVLSAYLKLLIFLPAILIPACESSSPAFLMMYSACKLNKQGDNIQTPFPIWNQFVVPCPLPTVASWPSYLSSQEAGQVVWYSHLFQNFPQFIVIRTVKGFGIVNKAGIDVLLELSCFISDPADVSNSVSGSSVFSKTSLSIGKFTVHILLKPGLDYFEQSMWDECNCALIWAFFSITFLWDWNETWPFPVLWPLLSFPHLLMYGVQHFHSIIF